MDGNAKRRKYAIGASDLWRKGTRMDKRTIEQQKRDEAIYEVLNLVHHTIGREMPAEMFNERYGWRGSWSVLKERRELGEAIEKLIANLGFGVEPASESGKWYRVSPMLTIGRVLGLLRALQPFVADSKRRTKLLDDAYSAAVGM